MPETHTFLPHAGSIWAGDRGRQPERQEPTPQQVVSYRCPKGHDFEVPFSAAEDAEVEVPDWWECRSHGVMGLRDGCDETQPPAIKHGDRRRLGNDDGKTHWDRLRERRSLDDLRVLLNERLAGMGHCDGLGPESGTASRGNRRPERPGIRPGELQEGTPIVTTVQVQELVVVDEIVKAADRLKASQPK